MAEQVKVLTLQTRGPGLHRSWKLRKVEGENRQLTRFTPVCPTVPNNNQPKLGNNNEESLIKQKAKKFFICFYYLGLSVCFFVCSSQSFSV